MTWQPYRGTAYLDGNEVEAWCRALAAAHPEWIGLSEIGTSRHGRPILLLSVSVGADEEAVRQRPAFWLDGGTHSAEWTGVMSCLYSLSEWVEKLKAGNEQVTAWFSRNAAFVVPIVSPDGYQALHEGKPFLRSTLRPPRAGTVRTGFEPRDMDGDGQVRWMRWRHPAGPWVADPELPVFMRPRTIDDDPADAFFFAAEGHLLRWDGGRWAAAPREFGLDLNRNFPAAWAPFSMFGMDGGDYPMSEPEAHALVEALAARPGVVCAVTNHTYTGCLLTQPYGKPSVLGKQDIELMHGLAKDAVRETGYKVYKVHPEFAYDLEKRVVGVWADSLATTFGISGYTLELWSPYAHADIEIEKPAEFFRSPDPMVIRTMLAKFAEEPGAVRPWTPFEHPQLGPVEIGGLDYFRTVRNPPDALLAEECRKGHAVAWRVARSTPQLEVETELEQLGMDDAGRPLWRLSVRVENHGYLATSGLSRAEELGRAPGLRLSFTPGAGVELLDPGAEAGTLSKDIGHLDGWGTARAAGSRHPVYPGLPARGHRTVERVLLVGQGAVGLSWFGARAGQGSRSIALKVG